MRKLCLLFGVSLGVLSAQTEPARIRVVHASPDAPAVDVLVNNAKVLEALPFREYSEYLTVPPGRYEVKVNVSGTATTVLSANPMLESGRFYTAMAVGFVGRTPSLELLLLSDEIVEPRSGFVRIRAIHAAPSAPAVDVYVTSPFETLEGKTPVLTGVPFKAASGYLEAPAATYQARVTVANTKTVAIDSGRVGTWSGIIRTFVAIENPGGATPFTFLILPDKN
ncbi:MAG: DUF4397 domain-containing protein [Bryobacteraceae bacterium]|nr:DUF4397 domain-containing protein [Bryobacteraceae bacterium]MDW8378724.1 DUF4397 domain-containing protein [Bryobacterales bacterium]